MPSYQPPVIQPNGGYYDPTVEVQLLGSVRSILYSTDGSDPAVEEPDEIHVHLYSNPITLAGVTTLRAVSASSARRLGPDPEYYYKDFSVEVTATFTVGPDTDRPGLEIISPKNGGVVTGDGISTRVDVQVHAEDVWSGIQKITWNCDGVETTRLFDPVVKAWDGPGILNLPATSRPNRRLITVRCFDMRNNPTERAVEVEDQDVTAPFVRIDMPIDGQRLPGGQPIRVRGKVEDRQTGVAKLEWALGDNTFRDEPVPVDGEWEFEIPATQDGIWTVYVKATDRKGNPRIVDRRFEVARHYKPKGIEDLLSARSYLDELLEFAEDNLREEGRPLSVQQIEAKFMQPFWDLKEGLSEWGNQPLNQLRAVIEVLGRFLGAAGGDNAETAYRQAAYKAMLVAIGTTYEEIRLARGADKSIREKLAEKLGFKLDPTHDQLEELLLQPEEITEAALESLFGLADTARVAGEDRQTPLLLNWRTHYLYERWREEDKPETPGTGRRMPLIDPDLIAEPDLAHVASDDPAFELLKDRRKKLVEIYDALVSDDPNGPEPGRLDGLLAETFAEITKETLKWPHEEVVERLVELSARKKRGYDVAPTLAVLHLTPTAFDYVIRLRALASTQTGVLDSEWEDAYQILVSARKGALGTNWRKDEGVIALTPEYFQVASESATLLPWRGNPLARQEWQNTLRARTDQFKAVEDALKSIVSVVEERTLPLLRDALVTAIGEKEDLDDPAEWLTEGLLIDIKGNGSQRTTRTLQAIETLQNLLFSVRTKRLATGNPAATWELASEVSFDEEWRWIGSHGTWRAATLTFMYPENLLLPSLREGRDQTGAFRRLVRILRSKARLSPAEARSLAATYLSDLGREGEGLVAHWTFDVGQGKSAADATDGGNTGTLDGATWTSGRLGGALRFDGSDDTVGLAISGALRAIVNDFTIAFWAQPEASLADDQESQNGTQGVSGQRYAYYPEQSGTAYSSESHAGVGISVGTNGVGVYEHSDNYLPALLVHREPLAGWVHVAVVYSDRQPKLFLNGAAKKTGLKSLKPFIHVGTSAIGGGKWGYFQGLIDDLRIYDRALAPEELNRLLATGSTLSVAEFRAPYVLSDLMSDADLRQLRSLGEAQLFPYLDTQRNRLKPSTPAHLREIFYFVPMQLALHLQKAGEYVAALDWFQTVYAYNLPIAERKIYYGLTLEENAPLNLYKPDGWLLELNPHQLAEGFNLPEARPNPYTRYTLTSLARCFVEFADAEFTRDTNESVARARSIYLTARGLLRLPDLETPLPTNEQEAVLPNPVIDALRLHVEAQLAKLRQGRNIAGMKRQIEIESLSAINALPTVGSGGQLIIPGAATRQPTPYRFSVLLERSKQLVGLAQQIEAAYLGALEKRDAENYNRIRAGHDLQLAELGQELQKRRVTEADHSREVAELQRDRTVSLQSTYQSWIDAGMNKWEKAMIENYVIGGAARALATQSSAAAAILQFSANAANPTNAAAAAAIPAYAVLQRVAAGASVVATAADAGAQVASVEASHERRVQEWQLQKNLADHDNEIAQKQIQIAGDHQSIVEQEEIISRTQTLHARAVADFLATKFTSAELYEWMSGILAGVYSYFLQQATSVARLAQSQLEFERQEQPRNFIQTDYWLSPAGDEAPRSSGQVPDRRGLTGSARLLQDIYQLDQSAFETDKRKLNLSETFSLARLAPFEFQKFRQTGVLSFKTSMKLFDRMFPGQYLRLIKRVRTSVVALIPPTQGIRATLSSLGISRVVVGGPIFQEKVIRRDPELVALSSPTNATGIFELDAQSDMLMPFESTGVDTEWEFVLPRAANPFDYSTIADVLMTLEYTALYSVNYCEQVVRNLEPTAAGQRSLSFRDHFPDQWYQLNNANAEDSKVAVSFALSREDFPPNLEDRPWLKTFLLYFAPMDGKPKAASVSDLRYPGPTTPLSAREASSDEGLFSTERGIWISLIGKNPDGDWVLEISDADTLRRLRDGVFEDIVIILGYEGRMPPWP